MVGMKYLYSFIPIEDNEVRFVTFEVIYKKKKNRYQSNSPKGKSVARVMKNMARVMKNMSSLLSVHYFCPNIHPVLSVVHIVLG